jgi:hypothetical protein
MANAYPDFFPQLKLVCPEIEFQTDLPQEKDINGDRLPKLFILDDLMDEVFNDPRMADTFSKSSHHHSLSIIFTLQNYFHTAKNLTIVRQCSYQVIFDNPSDKTLLRNISCKITPSLPQFLTKCFKILEHYFPDDDFLYILIDSKKKSPMKKLRIRSKVLPGPDGKIRPICFLE